MAKSVWREAVSRKINKTKRYVGYSSAFGLLGYFLIPVIPATAAIVVGAAVGAVIAKKLSKNNS